MADSKPLRVLAVGAVVLAALALARLADAFGKRELMRVARDVEHEREEVLAEYRELSGKREQLVQDEALLSHRIAAMSRAEHYLVINRRRQRLQIALGDKEMLDIRFRLQGPSDDVDGFTSLPKATLEVLGKRSNTDWYRPDWLYQIEGLPVPADSSMRLVKNAFGPGEIFLGGGISIHGRRDPLMPEEAVDHTYLELDEESLTAVLDAIQPGARVFIE